LAQTAASRENFYDIALTVPLGRLYCAPSRSRSAPATSKAQQQREKKVDGKLARAILRAPWLRGCTKVQRDAAVKAASKSWYQRPGSYL